MGKITLAICDTDDAYRERFVAYMVERKGREYVVYAFSSVEHLQEALDAQRFDVAILGRGFGGVEELVCEKNIAFISLKEVAPVCVAEDSSYLVDANEKRVEVFRYQPMEKILHEVTILVGGERGVASQEKTRLLRMQIIGVYSPIQHEMQLPFSLVFAEMLARRQKVIYINLMKNSGFMQAFGLSGEYDMADIIVRLRNKRLCAETFLKCVYESNRLFYIPPFQNPEHLDEFTYEDMLRMLAFLEDSTDFDVVIFDFGEGMERFAEVIETCSCVYCLMKSGFFYECKLVQFLEYLEKSSAKEAREKIHLLNLPFSAKHIRGGRDVRKQLLWSEFGDYVRNYFEGGGK